MVWRFSTARRTISGQMKELFLKFRASFPVIQNECWFWQRIRTTGIPMFVPNMVRLLVWPYFRALTRETGRMSYQPLSNAPCSVFQYLLTTLLTMRDLQPSLVHTALLPVVVRYETVLVVTITFFDTALPTLAQEGQCLQQTRWYINLMTVLRRNYAAS